MCIAISLYWCYNSFEVMLMSDLKNKERIGTSLPIELAKQLREHSSETMVPISKIIEKAIEEYLKSAK